MVTHVRVPDTTHADDMVTHVWVPDTTHADDMVTRVQVPDTAHADDMVTRVRVPDTAHADDMVCSFSITRHLEVLSFCSSQNIGPVSEPAKAARHGRLSEPKS
ncbi:hypothetical protein Bbelb_358100 [Branchiostoma belcheri]|nr:hypothetical protein Bbelb_358100 [Branchiostoma belcheri]